MKTSDTHMGWFKIDYRTDKAIKVIDIESGVVDWVPLSQVDEIHEEPDGTFTIVMAKWLARKKGFTME